MPMTPVEATSTESAEIPRASAAHLLSAAQQSVPCFPVQALAMPEFTTTARAAGDSSTIFLSHTTGAAFTTLEVKVPAAVQGAVL